MCAGFSDGASYALSLGLPNGNLFSHIVAFSPGFMRAPTLVRRVTESTLRVCANLHSNAAGLQQGCSRLKADLQQTQGWCSGLTVGRQTASVSCNITHNVAWLVLLYVGGQPQGVHLTWHA